MERQIIISISREFGSGGHDIAGNIAGKFGLTMYDRSLLKKIAEDMDMDVEVLNKYDERPRNYVLTRRVGKYSNSMEDILVEKQFEFIRKRAESGESFVIVGRCAETVLRDFDGLISIFITGSKSYKLGRIMKQFELNEADAQAKMIKIDRHRRQYHNRYSDHKWGDSRYYDMCIDASLLGVEGTAEILEDYIGARIKAGV